MSGGSYNYAYYGAEAMAGLLKTQDDPRRQAFGRILVDVAHAMQDIEWVDSADMCDGDENDAIDCVLKKFLSPPEFEEVRNVSNTYQAQGKR
jgi:hypothetical protein